MSDIVERLAGWENKGHEGDPMVDMLLDDVSLALAEIRRLQGELAETRDTLGWLDNAARDAERSNLFDLFERDPDDFAAVVAEDRAVRLRERASEKGLAAAFPFQTEEAKER